MKLLLLLITAEEGKLLKLSMQRMAFAAKDASDAKEKNKLAYGYYKRFDNMFTGPGKVKNGNIEPFSRKQSLKEMTENLLICPTNEMIESMHRISEEVIPYFKKSSSQVA